MKSRNLALLHENIWNSKLPYGSHLVCIGLKLTHSWVLGPYFQPFDSKYAFGTFLWLYLSNTIRICLEEFIRSWRAMSLTWEHLHVSATILLSAPWKLKAICGYLRSQSALWKVRNIWQSQFILGPTCALDSFWRSQSILHCRTDLS